MGNTNQTDEQNQNQNQNGSEQEQQNNNSQEQNTSGEKSFTQSQVSSMMAKEKRQGRESVYKELGIDVNDSKMVELIKNFIGSQKTSEQVQQEEAAAAAAKIAEAEHKAYIAEVKVEAMKLGVSPEYVDDAVTLSLAKKTDDSDIKSIVAELKSKYPMWFTTTEEKGGPAGQKGTGASVNGSEPKPNGEKKGLGARLAAQRNSGGETKKSFWS
nr:MAG TPA: Major capsid protein [Caudoviricetes sp.]